MSWRRTGHREAHGLTEGSSPKTSFTSRVHSSAECFVWKDMLGDTFELPDRRRVGVRLTTIISCAARGRARGLGGVIWRGAKGNLPLQEILSFSLELPVPLVLPAFHW